MSKASSTLLGRRIWASVKDSSLPTSSPCFRGATASLRAGQLFSSLPTSTPSRRATHTERPFERRTSPHGPNTKRSFTSGGLLLVGFTTNLSPSAQPAASSTTCATAPESACNAASKSPSIRCLARQGWRRGVHTDNRTRQSREGERRLGPEEGTTEAQSPRSPSMSKQDATKAPKAPEPGDRESTKHDPESITQTMSKYLHMPKMPHRPTRDELLAAANGFWERLKVRFKWASIRSMRPWNIDEWGAFISWLLFGHLLWVLVGTTTFFSLVILSINTVFAQGWCPFPCFPLVTE